MPLEIAPAPIESPSRDLVAPHEEANDDEATDDEANSFEKESHEDVKEDEIVSKP